MGAPFITGFCGARSFKGLLLFLLLFCLFSVSEEITLESTEVSLTALCAAGPLRTNKELLNINF